MQPDRHVRSRFPRRVGGDTVEIATDDPNEAPSAAQERPTGVGRSDPTSETAQTISAGREDYREPPEDLYPTEHHPAIDGYWSPRCRAGMSGCDDQACVCTCHDKGTNHG